MDIKQSLQYTYIGILIIMFISAMNVQHCKDEPE